MTIKLTLTAILNPQQILSRVS